MRGANAPARNGKNLTSPAVRAAGAAKETHRRPSILCIVAASSTNAKHQPIRLPPPLVPLHHPPTDAADCWQASCGLVRLRRRPLTSTSRTALHFTPPNTHISFSAPPRLALVTPCTSTTFVTPYPRLPPVLTHHSQQGSPAAGCFHHHQPHASHSFRAPR